MKSKKISSTPKKISKEAKVASIPSKPFTKTQKNLVSETELVPQKIITQIQESLLAWYRHSHRDLPWRKTQDPYKIWISEIMLQQTRVETVKEYYRRFTEKFPTPQHLAKAPLEEVLSLWSGLGYYARARNLHKAAQDITVKYGGQFPESPEQVYDLPGIGPYTGGAILSIAFGKQAPIVDGNVIRVLSRLFTIDDAIELSTTKQKYWNLAKALVPAPHSTTTTQIEAPEIKTPVKRKTNPISSPESTTLQNHPGDFNQALMELGATVCLPQNPTCLVCPLNTLCQARLSSNPNLYPPKKPEKEIPTIDVVTFILEHKGEILLTRRPPIGLWGGLYEFPTMEKEPFSESNKQEAILGKVKSVIPTKRANQAEQIQQLEAINQKALLQLASEKLGISLDHFIQTAQALPPFEQTLTHRHFRFSPYLLSLPGTRPNIKLNGSYDQSRWINPKEPQALGFSVWMSKLLKIL